MFILLKFVITVSTAWLLPKLVQVIDVLANVFGEVQCVVSYKLLGNLGLPRLQRFDDTRVINNGL